MLVSRPALVFALSAIPIALCSCSTESPPDATAALDASMDASTPRDADTPRDGSADGAIALTDASHEPTDADVGGEDAAEPPDAGPWRPPPYTVDHPPGVSDRLRCGVPASAPLSSDVKIGAIGTGFATVVGVDSNASAIGATFELKKDGVDAWVNVLETRSGAGAAWQTSSLVWDNPGGVGIIVNNQSAGNSVGSQWMYRTTASVHASSLETSEWTPVPSDHIHTEAGGHSPCNGTGYVFDDMKQDIFRHRIPTEHGTAVLWQNVVSYRSRVDQSWPSWRAEQAFYLSRSVARAGDLRIYFVRGSTTHGPIRPYNDGFSIPGATCRGGAGTYCNTPGYDYVVLVWNIHGLDLGVAIDDVPETALNLEDRVYCGDPSNDACGNINFHAWFDAVHPASFTAGEIRTMHKNYYVGTLAQLADLGFPLRR